MKKKKQLQNFIEPVIGTNKFWSNCFLALLQVNAPQLIITTIKVVLHSVIHTIVLL